RPTNTTSKPSCLRRAGRGMILRRFGGCWSALWRSTPSLPRPELNMRSLICSWFSRATPLTRVGSTRRKRKPGKRCGTTLVVALPTRHWPGPTSSLGRKELIPGEVEKALQGNADEPTARLWLALYHSFNGDYAEALQVTRQILARWPVF